MRRTKLPSTWYSTIPMNKPPSLVKSACFKCFVARGFAVGGSDKVSLDFERGEPVVHGFLGDGDRNKGEGDGGGDSERGRDKLVDGERGQ